jgi:hypothetical protein
MKTITIITDGLDMDGRVGETVARKYAIDYGLDTEVIYLDRNRKVMKESKWGTPSKVEDEAIGKQFSIESMTNKNVMMIDLKLDTDKKMDRLNFVSNSFLCFDHHDASDYLLNQDYFCHSNHFETRQCGASVAWKTIYTKSRFNDDSMPLLVRLTRDRDIWIKEMLPFSDILTMIGFSFTDKEMMDMLNNDDYCQEMLDSGLEEYQDYQNEVKRIVNEDIKIGKFGNNIVAYTKNIKYEYLSDAGSLACKEHDCNFYINQTEIKDEDGKFVTFSYSMRSVDHEVDCLARAFGGNGHALACGFRSNFNLIVE